MIKSRFQFKGVGTETPVIKIRLNGRLWFGDNQSQRSLRQRNGLLAARRRVGPMPPEGDRSLSEKRSSMNSSSELQRAW